jgi:tRNA threonylcarbamoyl adenosine modification protein YeaZ
MMLALSRGEEMLFQNQQAEGSHRYHSAILIPTLQEGLQQCGITLEDLGGITVNLGPGSFTGIRTGVNTVRTLAQFLETPVYGLNHFDILAATQPGTTLALYLDAFRGNVYHSVVRVSAEGVERLQAPCLKKLTEVTFPEDPEVTCWASQKLLEQWGEQARGASLEDLNVFSPEGMRRLVAWHGAWYQLPWRKLLPLYLQEPNITQRKPQPGRHPSSL